MTALTYVFSIEDTPYPGPFTVRSDNPDEPLWDAINRAIVEKYGPEAMGAYSGWGSGEAEGWMLADKDGGDTVGPIWSGGKLTVGEMVAFLGDEAESGRVSLGTGWGGDGDFIGFARSILELLGDGVLARGGLTWVAGKMRDEANAKRRRLAADYRDNGDRSLELEQEVYVRREWEQKEFEERFELSADTSARLMKELGYEVEQRGKVRWWVDKRKF